MSYKKNVELVEQFKRLAIDKYRCEIAGLSEDELDDFEDQLAPFKLGEDLRYFLANFGGGTTGDTTSEEEILCGLRVLSIDESFEHYQRLISLTADWQTEISSKGWPDALLPLCHTQYSVLVLLHKELQAESEILFFYPGDGDPEVYTGHHKLSRMLELAIADLSGEEVDIDSLETAENGDEISYNIDSDQVPSDWFA